MLAGSWRLIVVARILAGVKPGAQRVPQGSV